MNSFGFSNLATAGVLLLTLGSAPGTLHGQTPTQPERRLRPLPYRGLTGWNRPAKP